VRAFRECVHSSLAHADSSHSSVAASGTKYYMVQPFVNPLRKVHGCSALARIVIA